MREFMTQEKLSHIKIAQKIASDFLKCTTFRISFIGEGSNNKNYLARTKGREIVVKLSAAHKEYKALDDYQKEKWCIEKSSERGVLGPTVLDLGRTYGRAYMIETFVPGINGKKVKDKLGIYRGLGKYAKRIHSITASGFGETLKNSKKGIFKDSLKKYLDYNIKSLTDNDKLLDLKVITKEQSRNVKKIFQHLKKQKFTFGLNHGDLSPANTLVDKSGKIALLDWGCAEIHIVPHFELMYLLRSQIEKGSPTVEELNEFLKGYGMSQRKFVALRGEILNLMLLDSFDRLRWAIDRKPAKIKEFSKRVKRVLNVVFRGVNPSFPLAIKKNTIYAPLEALETVWGLHGVRLVRILQNFDERTVSLIKSREGEYVFKTAPAWKNRRGVKKDTDVFDALVKKGFCHAPKLIKTKRDTTFLQKGKKFFYLLEYVDGQSPKRTAATYAALGRIAAELHSVKRFPFHGDFDPAKILVDLRGESYKYSFGEEYRTIIRQLPNFSKLKQSLIHTDIAPSNAIQKLNGDIVFVDWDDAGIGSTAIDLGSVLNEIILEDTSFSAANLRAFYESYFSHVKYPKKELPYIFDGCLFFALMYMKHGDTSKRWKRIKWLIANRTQLERLYGGM